MMEAFLNIKRKENPNTSSLSKDDQSQSAGSSSPSTSPSTSDNNKSNKRTKYSLVWDFFKKSSDKKFAKCLNCGKEYKTSGNTTNLNDHLKRFHPDLISRSTNDQNITLSRSNTGSIESGSNSTSTASSARSSVRSISPFFKREVHYDSNSRRKKELDRALTLMVARDFQPFNIVNDEGFRSFVQLLNPQYVIPSKYTIRETIMKKLYSESTNVLKNILSGVRYVAITSDSWTSAASESYLTITCHFVTQDFELKSAVLSTKPLENGINHTSENLATALFATFCEWNIDKKISAIVTDNAQNMIKTCEILKIKHMPCFAHTINLVVQDGVKIAPIKNILIKCKEIVRFLKSSNVASETFKTEQNTNSALKLVQEVSTRWNSAYKMILRILETHEALNRTLLKIKKAPSPLTAEEIGVLRDISKTLKCFDEATTKISGSKYVTISLTIPITFGIYNNLVNEVNPNLATEEGKQICSKLVESVQTRLFLYERRSITQIGTLVDPRFKKEGFKSQDNATAATRFLEQEMINILKKEASTESTPTFTENMSDGTGKESSSSSLFGFMQERLHQKTKSSTVDAIITKRQYLERQNAAQGDDPLLFWKVNGRDLHPLEECAKKYLCVPASSVEFERTFSTTGSIITDRRSRLKSKNVDILTFLNKNDWLTKKVSD